MSDKKLSPMVSAFSGMLGIAEKMDKIIEDQKAEIAKLLTILKEAELQIEYLHDKFQATSSGVAVLTRIRIVLDEQKGGDDA